MPIPAKKLTRIAFLALDVSLSTKRLQQSQKLQVLLTNPSCPRICRKAYTRCSKRGFPMAVFRQISIASNALALSLLKRFALITSSTSSEIPKCLAISSHSSDKVVAMKLRNMLVATLSLGTNSITGCHWQEKKRKAIVSFRNAKRCVMGSIHQNGDQTARAKGLGHLQNCGRAGVTATSGSTVWQHEHRVLVPVSDKYLCLSKSVPVIPPSRWTP